MIYLLIVVIAFFMIYFSCKHPNTDSLMEGGVLLVIAVIIVYILTIVCTLALPTTLQSRNIKLEAQGKYVASFPKVPVPKEAKNSNIDIDLANNQVANKVIEQTMSFFKEAQEYNSTILFWRSHRHLDLIIWGFPLIGKRIAALPLIKLDTFSRSP